MKKHQNMAEKWTVFYKLDLTSLLLVWTNVELFIWTKGFSVGLCVSGNEAQWWLYIKIAKIIKYSFFYLEINYFYKVYEKKYKRMSSHAMQDNVPINWNKGNFEEDFYNEIWLLNNMKVFEPVWANLTVPFLFHVRLNNESMWTFCHLFKLKNGKQHIIIH